MSEDPLLAANDAKGGSLHSRNSRQEMRELWTSFITGTITVGQLRGIGNRL